MQLQILVIENTVLGRLFVEHWTRVCTRGNDIRTSCLVQKGWDAPVGIACAMSNCFEVLEVATRFNTWHSIQSSEELIHPYDTTRRRWENVRHGLIHYPL